MLLATPFNPKLKYGMASTAFAWLNHFCKQLAIAKDSHKKLNSMVPQDIRQICFASKIDSQFLNTLRIK